MRTSLTQNQHTAVAQHFKQMTQGSNLVAGAMECIDGEYGIELAPRPRFVEIIACDRASDLLPLEQNWLQVRANEFVGDMGGQECTATPDAGAKFHDISTKEILL